MFTEDEPKEKLRKLSSSPSSVGLNNQSPTQLSTVPEGTEVPAYQPEVLPPVSASQLPVTVTSSPPSSPHWTSRPASVKVEPSGSPKPSSHMMQLLQHQHHHHHHQQQQQSQHKAQDRDHNQQQQQQHFKDVDMQYQQEKRNNSDSDSSGNYGHGDGTNDSHNSKRYSELPSDVQKDDHYWEKRRKNNEAARKSREKRRMHDMVMEGRICNLESDNGRLRRELLALKKHYNLPQDANLPIEGPNTDDSSNEQPVRLKMSPQPPASSHPIHNASSPSMAAKAPHGRTLSHSSSYTSPPPLLAVAGAMQMGMAIYPSAGPGLPYFFPEAASKMTHEGGALPPPVPGLHMSQHSMIPCHPSYPVDHPVKQEPYEEDFRIRERSNSNIERRTSSYPMDMTDIPVSRRGSVGNYVQYCPPPVSPPIATQQTHPTSMVSRAKQPHFLPRPSYESSYSHSQWSQRSRSPVSSHSSDDNYDEPLQLTVRRDSNISNISSNSNNHYDDNSRDSDQGATPGDKHTSNSPPATSFPLKLRHKLPSYDGYPKDLFPSMGSAVVPSNQPSFSTHPFINGLAHLSDMAHNQNNPLSLIKKESSSSRQRKDPSYRHGSRRNPLDQKYMDPKYLERRRRNNEAARKCRENRKTLTKLREVKSDYLETENCKLRDELNGLQEEMKQLRELIEKKRLEQGLPEGFSADS